jgi:hypothetical protein
MALIMITVQAELVEIATELDHLISLRNVRARLARHAQARIQDLHCMAATLHRSQVVPATLIGQSVNQTISQDLMVISPVMAISIHIWEALLRENRLELTAQNI